MTSVHLKDLEKLTRSVMSNRREGMMVDDPKQDVIATWFVADTKDEIILFPASWHWVFVSQIPGNILAMRRVFFCYFGKDRA